MAFLIAIAGSERRYLGYFCGALAIVLIGTATWVWAHEGHAALPTKGATVDLDKGLITLSPEAYKALGVETAEVDLRPVQEQVLAYATLEAPWQQHAYVTTRVPGRIAKLLVRAGQTVEAKQPLAEVESLEVENLQLELLNAQNDVQLSAKTLQQLKPLFQNQSIPERELREAAAKHQENLNAVEIARSKLLSLGLTAEKLDQFLQDRNPELIRTLPILSPIQGVVIHTDLTVGKVIETNEHLFEIMDLSTVWVKIGVLEKDLSKVAVEQPVDLTLSAYPDEVFRSPQMQGDDDTLSKVKVKGLYLDPQTHLGTIWAELKNRPGSEPRFLPGLNGQAQITVSKPGKMLTIPAAALITDGAERYVLVEETASAKAYEYRKRNVVVGLQSSGYVQIQDGDVFAGDRVVTTGSHELATFFVQGVLRLSPEARRNIGLTEKGVERVQRRVVEEVIEFDGAVEVPPDHRAFVSTQLAGTLHKIHVDRGQAVQAGEIIGEIASLELQNLQLDLLRAHLQIGLLNDTLKRLRGVDETQLLARRRLWETESLYNATLNRRESLRRKLEAVGLSRKQVQAILTEKKLVEALPLRAPINGTVVHFDRVLGQVIKAEEPLFEIHDLSNAWVEGHLSERDLSKVSLGQTARVRLVAEPNSVLRGTVVRSGRMFGAENRALSVWVELQDRPNPLVPQHNMLARLTLTVRRPEPTLAVPLGAVLRDGTRAYVFVQKSVEKPDGTAEERYERRLIETGRADDRYVEVTRGLEAEESVAVQGTAELQTAYASVR